MKGRVIVVGDIHGCAHEFATLIDELKPTRHDRMILLGDLVNRGPDSAGVVALARRYAHQALLGNHELRLLNFRRTDDPSHLKKSDYLTLGQLGSADWAYLERMPLTFQLPEYRTVLVHGGFLPSRPWWQQSSRVVTRIQVVGPDGEAYKASTYPGSPHWSELWKGPPFVVYGHTPYEEPKKLKWSLGIDTGCVRGGSLTAYVLPGREFVQIRSAECWAKTG